MRARWPSCSICTCVAAQLPGSSLCYRTKAAATLLPAWLGSALCLSCVQVFLGLWLLR